ncbi:MAG: hypothetical protein MJ151_01115 [Lachnospiraceae bacterium]|nr:hypothetical protein [Lachnospiraceae bacterium]
MRKDIKRINDTIKKASIILDVKDRYICMKKNGKLDVNATAKKIESLYSAYAQKELIQEIGFELFDDFLELIQSVENICTKDLVLIAKKMRENQEPVFIKDLAITGNDLMNIGYSGKEIGIALKYLIQIVHKDMRYNDKQKLLEISKKAYKEIENL